MVVITFNIQMQQVSTASMALMPEHAVRVVQENTESLLRHVRWKQLLVPNVSLGATKETTPHLFAIHVQLVGDKTTIPKNSNTVSLVFQVNIKMRSDKQCANNAR